MFFVSNSRCIVIVCSMRGHLMFSDILSSDGLLFLNI